MIDSAAIDRYYEQHKTLSNYLLENNEISLKLHADREFVKVLAVACASLFESEIVRIISDYSRHVLLPSDEKIMSLLDKKIFMRQYHSFFDWKEERGNANKFFSMFGNAIITKYKKDKANKEDLKVAEENFINIGYMRNRFVHGNFAQASVDNTYEEIYEKFKSAVKFVKYVEEDVFCINQILNSDD